MFKLTSVAFGCSSTLCNHERSSHRCLRRNQGTTISKLGNCIWCSYCSMYIPKDPCRLAGAGCGPKHRGGLSRYCNPGFFFLARSGYLSCFLASLGCIASLELIGEFRIVSSANKYATSPLNAFPSPSSYTRKQVAATSLEMFETFDVD
jgi:hypothetical protein